VIPDSVIDIGEYAFKGCDQLEEVIAPARFHNLFPSPRIKCHSYRT